MSSRYELRLPYPTSTQIELVEHEPAVGSARAEKRQVALFEGDGVRVLKSQLDSLMITVAANEELRINARIASLREQRRTLAAQLSKVDDEIVGLGGSTDE